MTSLLEHYYTTASAASWIFLLLRLITVTTLKKVLEVEEQELKFPYDSRDYTRVYDLLEHSSQRNESHKYNQRKTVARVLDSLIHHGGFFPLAKDCPYHIGQEEEQCKDCVNKVAVTMLKHIEQMHCNCYAISDYNISVTTKLHQDKTFLGSAFYTTLSIINHSCDPNAYVLFYRNTAVVRAIQPIREGDEICCSYAGFFAVATREKRQKKLMNHYRFVCKCLPCEMDWPTFLSYKDMDASQVLKETRFQCVKCLVLVNDSGVCEKCENYLDVEKVKNCMEKYIVDDYGSVTLGKKSPLQLIAILQKMVTLLDRLLEKPHIIFIFCQETLLDCYKLLVNHYHCRDALEFQQQTEIY